MRPGMPGHRNRAFWIAAALLLKGGLAAVFLWKFVPAQAPHLALDGLWGQLANDSSSYLRPVDAFLATGELRELFGYRMYGYGLPYLLARLAFDRAAALNALIVAQIAVSALSVYVLALTAVRFWGSEVAFRAVFFGYFLLPFVSHFDVVVLTESFTASSLIFSLYFLIRDERGADALRSGAFLGWAIVLRPVTAPLALLWMAFLLRRALRRSRAPVPARAVLLFLAPLVAFEAPWVAGNLVYHGELTVVHASTWAPTLTDPRRHTVEMIEFQQAYGGDFYEDWRWFYGTDSAAAAPPIPRTSRFDDDSLALLRREMRTVQRDMYTLEPTTPPAVREATNLVVRQKLEDYARSIREERWLTYHVVAPARVLVHLLSSSPTGRMFGNYETMNPAYVPPRLVLDGVWWLLLLSAAAAVVIAAARWRNTDPRVIVVVLVLGYFVGIHAVALRMPDPRYLVPAAPLTLLSAAFTARVLSRSG